MVTLPPVEDLWLCMFANTNIRMNKQYFERLRIIMCKYYRQNLECTKHFDRQDSLSNQDVKPRRRNYDGWIVDVDQQVSKIII